MTTARALPDAPFGAQVDLPHGPIDLATAAELRSLLARHHLLVFRGERDDAEHLDLVAAFGRVLPQGPRVVVNDRPVGALPTITRVSNIAEQGGLGAYELGFHHDLAQVPTPPAGLSLYAIDVAPGQAATRFASGRLAYLRLSPSLQRRLEGLQALFSANYAVTTAEQPVPAWASRDALDPTWPRAVHPIVVPHPVTGEPCLFVNQMMTVQILGLPLAESDALLTALLDRIYAPENIYEHRWANGDLVVWDNLVLQHARDKLDVTTPRTLRRIVFGERAPWEDWPHAAPADRGR